MSIAPEWTVKLAKFVRLLGRPLGLHEEPGASFTAYAEAEYPLGGM